MVVIACFHTVSLEPWYQWFILDRVTLDNWTVYCYDSIIRQHNSTDHNADLYLRYCVGKATSNYWEMVREETERDRLEKEKANHDTKEVKRQN